jgi:nucleoid-associated protein YgaU
MHRAQPGDTFASLAQAYYGSERHTAFLIKQNPHIKVPSRIRVGELIKLPPLPSRADRASSESTSAVAASAPSRAPSAANRHTRTYEVQSGDSFYGVARDELGDSSRWRELFELNKEAVNGDPKRLKVGQVIVLPSA